MAATRLNLTGILTSTYSDPEIIIQKMLRAEAGVAFMSTTEAFWKDWAIKNVLMTFVAHQVIKRIHKHPHKRGITSPGEPCY